MASIQKIVSPLTGEVSYRVQIRRKGHPAESETFPTRKEASDYATSVEAAMREGRHYPHAAARRTDFSALLDDYKRTALLELTEKEQATRAMHLDWWADYLAANAAVTLADITSERIAAGRDALLAETFTRGKVRTNKRTGVTTQPRAYRRSGATVNRYVASLSALLSFGAKERHKIQSNPAENVARKKEPRGRTRFLTDEERTTLLASCSLSKWTPLATLVRMALTTGARKAELVALQWTDVDLKTGRALVRDSKNGEQRTLPLSGRVLEELREMKLQTQARSPYVFAPPEGATGPYIYFDAHWYEAVEGAGLMDFHFHDLRHTTASMLAAQGCSLLEIADVLGHKTLAMVKRYSHLVVDHKARVIEKLVTAKGL